MKIGGHLEQIADECVTIVRRAKKLNFDAVLRELALVERPRSLASGIFRYSIRAFAGCSGGTLASSAFEWKRQRRASIASVGFYGRLSHRRPSCAWRPTLGSEV
jgi:hypothetical protein